MKIHQLSIPLLLFCNLFFYCAKAQDFEKRFINLPFKQDSSHGFRNQFTRCDSVGSIKESNAEIEVRYYPKPLGRLPFPITVTIFSLYADHAVVSGYIDIDATRRTDGMNFKPVGKSGSTICYQTKKMEISRKTFYDMLDTLVQNHLFDLADQKHLIDSMKRKHIFIYNLCHNKDVARSSDCTENYNLVEVKMADKVRSFKYSNQAPFYVEYNPQIPVFNYYATIHDVLEHHK